MRCIVSLTLLWASLATGQENNSEPKPCPEIVTDLVPGLHARAEKSGLAHVEIRRCVAKGGSMQVVAWKAGAHTPSLVIDTARFSVGPLLMSGNVFAIVFPGPYDSVVTVQYAKGQPSVVFTDSTHDYILLSTTEKGVEVTLADGKGKREVKSFDVDEDALSAP